MTAVTPDPTPPLDDLFLVVYCLVDDLYRTLVPAAVRLRPGHGRMKLSDPEVLTLSVMQEALSADSEASFVRSMRRNRPGLFPGLLSRSRYHRRRKALVGVHQALVGVHQALFAHLAAGFAEHARWLTVDSAPVETTKVERSQTGAASIPEAAYHVRAARKQLFFGLRLHAVVTDEGAVVEFALAPADEGERAVAEGMLAAVGPASSGLVLGDNNYCGPSFEAAAARRGHRAATSPRRTDADRASRLWVRGPRALVETVFGMLADQFCAERTRARSLLGVWTRMVAKVFAFDLSLHINALLGRPVLAVKSLYA